MDAYRSAMVEHVRVRMVERYPSDHLDRLRHPFGDQWDQMLERVEDRHATGTVRRAAPDAYDLLDVAQFEQLFRQYFDVLAPALPRKHRDRFCQRLIESARFRHACAHPLPKDDLSYESAIRGLDGARSLLLDLRLGRAAEEVHGCMAEFHGSPASIRYGARRYGPIQRRVLVGAALAVIVAIAVTTALLARSTRQRGATVGPTTAECGVNCCGGILCRPDIRTNAGTGFSRHSQCNDGEPRCGSCASGRECVPFDCTSALPKARAWSLRLAGVRRGSTPLPESQVCVRVAPGVPPTCGADMDAGLGRVETERFLGKDAPGLVVEVKSGDGTRLGRLDPARYDLLLVSALCEGVVFRVPADDGGDDLVVGFFLDDG